MKEIKIGDLIKEARINSGYKTKKDFSKVTGVSPATLSRIENNTQEPTPETLKKISKHLITVTYGELMKAANYFNGLEDKHTNYIVSMFNECEELDEKIFELIDTCFLFTSFDKSLHEKLISMFTSPEIISIYEDASINEIKNMYYQNDYDNETKKKISEKLSSIINSYPPKLKTYFKEHRNSKPIPLVGTICAGDGLIANEEIEEFINYPFLKKQQPDYALKVKGDSMKNAGIDNGDIVFLRKASWVEFNGQIAAVIFNEQEGSLKRVLWTEGSAKFTLKPENDAYQPMEVSPNEMIVCGLYVGHYKTSN